MKATPALRKNGPARYRRNRGSVYLAVLGASTLVALLGITALAVRQVQRRTVQASLDALQAQLYAQSAIELAMAQMLDDPNWRTNYANDAWAPARALGRGTCRFKFVDEDDGDLRDNPADRVRIYGEGMLGDTSRLVSVLVEPPDAANLLVNGQAEPNTSGWTSYPSGSADLQWRDDSKHSGAGSIRVKSRDSPASGVAQTLTQPLLNDVDYEFELWVRIDGGSDQVNVRLALTSTGSGTQTLSLANAVYVGNNWTRIAGTFRPVWIGTLQQASLRLSTTLDKRDFYIDDLSIRKAAAHQGVTLLSGTWRQEVH